MAFQKEPKFKGLEIMDLNGKKIFFGHKITYYIYIYIFDLTAASTEASDTFSTKLGVSQFRSFFESAVG